MAEIDLADAIGDAMLFLRHEMISQKVVLRLDAPADLPKVMADRTQVQQVLVNLTINAIQAMRVMNETQRSLTVRARADGGHVVISVADTGPGIPEDHMPKLFESFFSTKENGMGIGLAICRSIVEAHGGTLSARNGESGGAVFEFRLPVMAAADHTDV
jgi:signal transduction histidine kinase